MNDFAERKCYHDKEGTMEECVGDVEVTVKVVVRGVITVAPFPALVAWIDSCRF